MIHDSVASSALMLVRMVGSATFTTVVSMRAIATPRMTTANASQVRLGTVVAVGSGATNVWGISGVLPGLVVCGALCLVGHDRRQVFQQILVPGDLGMQTIGFVFHDVHLADAQVLRHSFGVCIRLDQHGPQPRDASL